MKKVHLTDGEKQSIKDCLTRWYELHPEQVSYKRRVKDTIETAIREAEYGGPLTTLGFCNRPEHLKGRCRGCWNSVDPRLYDCGCAGGWWKGD